jgi:hypothetical protein
VIAETACGSADAIAHGVSGPALYTAQIFQRVEASGFFMGLEDISSKVTSRLRAGDHNAERQAN